MMEKKTISGPILVPKNVFVIFASTSSWIDIVPSYHPMQFKGKLMSGFFCVGFISTRC